MGINYVMQQPYDMARTYAETSPATPMFFVLFPGVDPTPWVESLARTLDITTDNGEPAFRHQMVCLSQLTRIFNYDYVISHVCGIAQEYIALLCNTLEYTCAQVIGIDLGAKSTVCSEAALEFRTLSHPVQNKPHAHVYTPGKFINISMGQGQEKPAEGVVER